MQRRPSKLIEWSKGPQPRVPPKAEQLFKCKGCDTIKRFRDGCPSCKRCLECCICLKPPEAA